MIPSPARLTLDEGNLASIPGRWNSGRSSHRHRPPGLIPAVARLCQADTSFGSNGRVRNLFQERSLLAPSFRSGTDKERALRVDSGPPIPDLARIPSVSFERSDEVHAPGAACKRAFVFPSIVLASHDCGDRTLSLRPSDRDRVHDTRPAVRDDDLRRKPVHGEPESREPPRASTQPYNGRQGTIDCEPAFPSCAQVR